jgi:hypothetical protein
MFCDLGGNKFTVSIRSVVSELSEDIHTTPEKRQWYKTGECWAILHADYTAYWKFDQVYYRQSSMGNKNMLTSYAARIG